MYSLMSLARFLEANAHRLGTEAQAILERAERVARHGLFSGGALREIMQDTQLTAEYDNVTTSDPEHIKLGIEALGVTVVSDGPPCPKQCGAQMNRVSAAEYRCPNCGAKGDCM